MKIVIALISLKWARVKTECVQKGLIPGRCLSNNNYGGTATYALNYEKFYRYGYDHMTYVKCLLEMTAGQLSAFCCASRDLGFIYDLHGPLPLCALVSLYILWIFVKIFKGD